MDTNINNNPLKSVGLALTACMALFASHYAANTGTTGTTGSSQANAEGKREAKEFFEDNNSEAQEMEEVFESEEWENESDTAHESAICGYAHEIYETMGGSGQEGVNEGRKEWMRENKEDQDGPPRVGTVSQFKF